jgi:dihydrofolate reductase
LWKNIKYNNNYDKLKMIFENKNNVKYSLIAGVPDNFVIGNGLKIPWYIPEDFKLFKQKTIDSVVIMGQLTWDSLPIKPLPKRINIVLNRENVENNGAHTFTDIEEAFKFASEKDKNIFVIGGASIYKQTIQHAKYLYISHIFGEFDGDILFPKFKKEHYKILEQEKFEKFEFCKYEKLREYN